MAFALVAFERLSCHAMHDTCFPQVKTLWRLGSMWKPSKISQENMFQNWCGPVAFPLLAFAPVAFELASVLLLALGAKFDHMVPCQREILQSFLSCSCGCYSIYATKYGRGFWRLRPVCVRDA